MTFGHTARFVAGTALCEPRCADFVAGTALCEPGSADFGAGAALCAVRCSLSHSHSHSQNTEPLTHAHAHSHSHSLFTHPPPPLPSPRPPPSSPPSPLYPNASRSLDFLLIDLTHTHCSGSLAGTIVFLQPGGEAARRGRGISAYLIKEGTGRSELGRRIALALFVWFLAFWETCVIKVSKGPLFTSMLVSPDVTWWTRVPDGMNSSRPTMSKTQLKTGAHIILAK